MLLCLPENCPPAGVVDQFDVGASLSILCFRLKGHPPFPISLLRVRPNRLRLTPERDIPGGFTMEASRLRRPTWAGKMDTGDAAYRAERVPYLMTGQILAGLFGRDCRLTL